MTGLETIVEQILQEAQKEAEEIKAQAARNAGFHHCKCPKRLWIR